MRISILFSYYKKLLFRNAKLNFYFITTFVVYIILLSLFAYLQALEAPHFYFHRILIFSYLFQFFYNHLYYGLGWESSFKHFVTFHMKMKNIIYMYVFYNFLYFSFSLVFIKIIALTSFITLTYSIFNIIIIYLFIPNLLFVFVFPLLTIYVDLFNNKKGLVIHKFYAFPILIFTITFPAILQHLWSNFSYGPIWISSITILGVLIVIIKFSMLVKFWERRLLQLSLE